MITEEQSITSFIGLPVLERKSAINVSKIEYTELNCNPLLGCSHRCIYCVSGDTLILMSNGTNIPIKDINIGDKIIGVQQQGRYRKYIKSKVLNHWKTTKPAINIVMENGTQVICSPDHRWLTNRGWKHTMGAMQGKGRQPYLTLANRIFGIGKILDPVKETKDYKRGYLAGNLRTDGSMGIYDYSGKNHRATEIQYSFRLAQKDEESVNRSKQYLNEFDIETNSFEMKYENENSSRTLQAIGTRKQLT